MKLIFQRNELDCGDAVLIADIILNQLSQLYTERDASLNWQIYSLWVEEQQVSDGIGGVLQ
jgi:hypothetical protein